MSGTGQTEGLRVETILNEHPDIHTVCHDVYLRVGVSLRSCVCECKLVCMHVGACSLIHM